MFVESHDYCHSAVHVKEARITTIGGKMSRVILHRIYTYLAALVQFKIDLMVKSLGTSQSCACVVSAFADGGDESWTLCGGIPGRSRLVLGFVWVPRYIAETIATDTDVLACPEGRESRQSTMAIWGLIWRMSLRYLDKVLAWVFSSAGDTVVVSN
jgi:hypothetical protein